MIFSENRLPLFGIMLKLTRLGWRPGTALAVGGPWRKPGSPTLIVVIGSATPIEINRSGKTAFPAYF